MIDIDNISLEQLTLAFADRIKNSNTINVYEVIDRNYDMWKEKLFPVCRFYGVSVNETVSQLLSESGITNINSNKVCVYLNRVRKERGELSARDKRKALLMGSKPQNQVITTAPKVNDNAIKGVYAPSVVVDTVKTTNKAPETIKNDAVMVEAQSGIDISPEVINSIKINIDDTDIDMNIELARLVQEFDNRKEKGFTFSEMDRQLLIYFTNYSFKLNKNLTELSLAIEDYHTTLKEVLKYYKFKCNQLQIDLKLYGKSKN